MDVQMISCGSFSVLVLVNGKVFLREFSILNPKKKSKFEEVKLEKEISLIACSSSSYYVCDNDGNLFSWGENSNGQLGHGDDIPRDKPTLIEKLKESVMKISGGAFHFVALTKNHEIFVCGKNKNGQLGLGDFEDRKFPEKINFIEKFGLIIQIVCGDEQTVILNEKGEVNAISKIFASGGYGGSYIICVDINGRGYSVGSNSFWSIRNWNLKFKNQIETTTQKIDFNDNIVIHDCACGWIHSCFVVSQIPQENETVLIENIDNQEDFIREEQKRISESLGDFEVLPIELIYEIFSYLEIDSLVRLSFTSSEMNFLSSYDWIWKSIFERNCRSISKRQQNILNNPRRINTKYKQAYMERVVIDGDAIFHPSAIAIGKEEDIPKKPFWKKKKEIKILMQGLDASGKTAMLYNIKLKEIVTTIPTVGFNVEVVELPDFYHKLMLWDVGGADRVRRLWRHYIPVFAMIIVIDSNGDEDRMEQAKEEMLERMNDPVTKNCIFLIFCSKQDLPYAKNTLKVVKMLGLDEVDKCWAAFPCSAYLRSSLIRGLRWLDYQFYISNPEKNQK
ncbi:adp ribosylation factor-related [Anaeramoeba ignava]|uniref:Adp ribosylation factor-related n=1 Tax=Anaeramoeba ignava TaxID=1746090 RepID=A0A9Q0LRC3_ANAIG|nr:adp ribosylation factor-related [Anaeramoeba ignava]